jgi:hypothetical protein
MEIADLKLRTHPLTTMAPPPGPRHPGLGSLADRCDGTSVRGKPHRGVFGGCTSPTSPAHDPPLLSITAPPSGT